MTAEQLAQAREMRRKRLALSVIAHRLGVSKATVLRYLRGDRRPA